MKRVKVITYLIIAYVAAFMIWWMILLGKLETQQFELKKELIELKRESNKDQLPSLEKDHKQNKSQFIYEGIVFFILLAGSSYFVIKGIQREQKQNQVNKNFLLATTHELKTPLATTKLNLQTLLQKELNPTLQSKLLGNSVIEIDRLNQLVDNILLASKLDTPNYKFELVATDITELVEGVINTHHAKDRLKLITDQTIRSKTDPASLKIVLQNLIDNALKYSEKVVHINLKQESQNIKIAVIDEGIGINSNEKKYIFNRFYRVEQEETRTTKGTGLGLYLVKEMTALLGGSIEVKDNMPNGSIFNLEFPLKNG